MTNIIPIEETHQRWIVQIIDGRVMCAQKIPFNAVVLPIDALPAVVADRSLVDDDLSQRIADECARRA